MACSVQSRHIQSIMPKQISTKKLDSVFRTVAKFLDGAALDEIASCVKESFPRRTLQRRLASLVAQERLILEGAGRGGRYRVTPTLRRTFRSSGGIFVRCRSSACRSAITSMASSACMNSIASSCCATCSRVPAKVRARSIRWCSVRSASPIRSGCATGSSCAR